MATDDRAITDRRGGGRIKTTHHITLAMLAVVTVDDSSFTPPFDSRVSDVRVYNPVAATGSPTNINLSMGKTAGGADYVAAVDVKAANSTTALTKVALPDWLSWPAGQAMFFRLAAVGGTNPAATVTVEVDFSAPNP